MGLTNEEKKAYASWLIKEEISTAVNEDTIREGWLDYNGDEDDELSDKDVTAIDDLVMNARITVEFPDH
ncbi:MAG TPA: hypothetical protein VHK27_06080 [Gammaproteobacteria bacterium]|nr:hypothetical protein [Gammaproteobacteria bacterium]